MNRIMRACQYGKVIKTEERYEVIDRKYIGTSAVVFLIKENGRYIVVDSINAYYPYENLETAKLSFAARCSYLEEKEKQK